MSIGIYLPRCLRTVLRLLLQSKRQTSQAVKMEVENPLETSINIQGAKRNYSQEHLNLLFQYFHLLKNFLSPNMQFPVLYLLRKAVDSK